MNYLLTFAPIMLIQLGNYIKGRDSNNTGSDDAFASVLIAIAPVIDGFAHGNESAVKKALRAARTTIDNYLGE